jgi:uncharacterized membrane protein
MSTGLKMFGVILLREKYLSKKWYIVSAILLYYLVIKFTRHFSLQTYGFDLSAFDYALSNWSSSPPFFTPFFGKSYLSEHFFPSLVLVLPFHLLLPHPETLLVLQAVMVAAAGIPFYSAIHKLTKSDLSAVVYTAAFLLNPWMLRGMAFDFHIEMIQPLAIALIFYGIVSEKKWVFVSGLIILFGSKENQWLSGVVLGLVMIAYKSKRSMGIITLLISIVTAVFVLFFWAPTESGSAFNYYLQRYSPYGNSPFKILFHIVTHPALLFSEESGALFLKLILRCGILSVISPFSLPALPEFFIHTLSFGSQQKNLQLYYSAAVVSWVFVGSAFGFSVVRIVVSSMSARLLLLVIIASVSFLPFGKITKEKLEVIALVKSIPPGCRVVGENELIPHLKKQNRIRVVEFVNIYADNWDYVILNHIRHTELFRDLSSNGLFKIERTLKSYVLLKKNN